MKRNGEPSSTSPSPVAARRSSINPSLVNWSYVKECRSGDADYEKNVEMNARYCISLAQKYGAVVFLCWEDIAQVNPKLIMAYVASLMYTYKKKNPN